MHKIATSNWSYYVHMCVRLYVPGRMHAFDKFSVATVYPGILVFSDTNGIRLM